MVNVATSSIEAASTEDNIGSTGNLDHQPDPETKVIGSRRPGQRRGMKHCVIMETSSKPDGTELQLSA